MHLPGLALSTATALTVGLLGATAAPAHASDRDCGDFASQQAAQIFFLENGGPGSDPHRLDSDGDGIACETNPGPYYYGTSTGGTTSGGSTGGSTSSAAAPPKPTVIRQRARVVRVVDGDTVNVRLVGGAIRRVRLIGIDTPEVFGGTECGGRQASRSMKRMLRRGTRVLLVSDPTQQTTDRYGRLLRYVHRRGTLDVGRRQVFRGNAKVYVYNSKPFRRTALYRKVQRRARSADRGLWGSCG